MVPARSSELQSGPLDILVRLFADAVGLWCLLQRAIRHSTANRKCPGIAVRLFMDK